MYQLFAYWVIFYDFLLSADIFFKINFFGKKNQDHLQEDRSGSETVCKSYQQTILVGKKLGTCLINIDNAFSKIITSTFRNIKTWKFRYLRERVSEYK